MKKINKYIGIYRVFSPLDEKTGKITANSNDTYLKGRHNIEIYRYKNNMLAIYFPGGKNTYTLDTVLKLEDAGIKLTLQLDGDKETVYLFKEDYIDIVHKIINFQTRGKNIKPSSIKTARRYGK